VSGGGGNLTFDATGTLTAMTGTPISFNFTGGAAAAQSIAVSYGPLSGAVGDQTTQYAQSSAINSFTQDGNAAGSLQSLVIDREGYLTGQYSNGATVNIAQITLANFPNVQGLLSVGNNNFSESRVSGQPLLGAAQSGNLGSIRSSSLEQSNVDLASEFVRLIINQRAFQANTRTISTTNDLLGALVQLGQ
jgi:flagellar hook protein FlgE